MAGFVCDDANEHFWFCGGANQPGMNENIEAARNKCIHRRIIDNQNTHVCGRDIGRIKNRIGVSAQRMLDLGVANQPCIRSEGREGEYKRGEAGKKATEKWPLLIH